MPENKTILRTRRDAREGKAPTTQAGEFVREEIEHIRHGKHGARSAKQAIAIGLSKARRAGVALPPPKKGRASARVRKQAKRDLARAGRPRRVSPKRSAAVKTALRREGHEAASPRALAYQARTSRRRSRGPAKRKGQRPTSRGQRAGPHRSNRTKRKKS